MSKPSQRTYGCALGVVGLVAVVGLAAPRHAGATYPGGVGKLSYTQQTAYVPDTGPVILGNEIRTIDAIDGSGNQALTSWPPTATFVNPRWSPDGTRLASWEGLRTGPRIYLMLLDATGDTIGTGDVQLLLDLQNGNVANAGPSWSPDGTKLAIALGLAGGGIYTLDIATKTLTPVLTNPSATLIYDQPAWSPDGQSIAVRIHQLGVGIYGHRDDIGIFPAAGGAVTNLTQNRDPGGYPGDFGCVLGNPNWAPDGSRIAYGMDTCDHPGIKNEFDALIYSPAHQLATVAPPSGVPVLLQPGRGSGFFDAPVYSPDGSLVVATDHFDVRQIWFIPVAGGAESHFQLEQVPGSTQGPGAAYLDWQPLANAVKGVVAQRDKLPVDGITVSLVGKNDDGDDVSYTTTTDEHGAYSFVIAPGTYTVSASGDAAFENGGGLSADPAIGGRCPGTASKNACQLGHVVGAIVDFVYTPCGAEERHPNGKPPTSCPIIFLPGFLGTRVTCPGAGGAEELWANIPPGPRFGDMTLLADGFTDAGDPGSCSASAAAVAGLEGLVATVAGQSIYQTSIDFLERIAPLRWSAYAYDWRRAVPEALPGLDALVDATLKDTGASRVVLMAHSMGGLVTRAYLQDPARAEKVSRAVTVGTPYWGAPKTHFALLEGDTDTPAGTLLDLLTNAGDLQRFARNAFGAFWLYPSANFGSWLSIAGVPQDTAGVDRWIAALGATPALLDAALAGHAQIDGFKTNGVDYEVVVGAGLATVTSMNVRTESIANDEGFVEIGQWAELHYGSGDGTVPARSATQGALDTGVPLGDAVPIHYVCGIGHVALPGERVVDDRIEKFLLEGSPVAGPEDNCPYSGLQVRFFQIDLLTNDAVVLVGGASPLARNDTDARPAATETLTVTQAASRGLVALYDVGDRTTLVIDGRKPVTLQLGGTHQPIQVQTIGSGGEGPWRSYAAGTKPLTIGVDGAVMSNGKVEKTFKVKGKPPRTKARVKKKGGVYSVKLRAKAPNGLGATYYRLGEQGAVRYTAPLTLTAGELASLTYASVDAFGAMEPWRSVKRRR